MSEVDYETSRAEKAEAALAERDAEIARLKDILVRLHGWKYVGVDEKITYTVQGDEK